MFIVSFKNIIFLFYYYARFLKLIILYIVFEYLARSNPPQIQQLQENIICYIHNLLSQVQEEADLLSNTCDDDMFLNIRYDEGNIRFLFSIIYIFILFIYFRCNTR